MKSFKGFSEMMTAGDAGIPQDTANMKPKGKRALVTRRYIEVNGKRKLQCKESVEQVDELSDKLLKRYDRKSATSARNLRKKMNKVVDTVKKNKSGVATMNQLDRYTKAMDKHSNRMDGANRSQQTQLRRAMGESAEQVDELSIDTLSRYNSKASKDPKRAKMNNKAVGKIVKKTMQGESVEQVDEISDKLVKNYRVKAMQDVHNRLDKRGSNLTSRQAPSGRKKLAKSIKKTKSNLDRAKKSVFSRDKKVAKAQAARDSAVSSFKDRKDNERRLRNRERGIERTDRKGDAADKKKPGSAEKRGLRGFSGYGESVEEGRYPTWNKAKVALNKDKKSGKKKDYKVLSPAEFMKGRTSKK